MWNKDWPLQSMDSRDDLNRLYCGRNLTDPGPLCNLKGGAAYLLAGRFNGSAASDGAENVASSRAGKAWSTAANVPWLIADYILTKTATQKSVGVLKTLEGTAQVDVFLCSDSNCTVMADITTIIGQNVSQAEPWCSGSPAACLDDAFSVKGTEFLTRYRYKHGSKGVMYTPARVIQFRMLGIGPDMAIPTAVVKNATMGSFVRAISKGTSPGGEMRYEVVWQENSHKWNTSRLRSTNLQANQFIVKEGPALMPVGVLLRLETSQEIEADAMQKGRSIVGSQGSQLLQYGMFSVQDLETKDTHCALIVLPPLHAAMMHQLGWNRSSAKCTKPTHAYVFDSRFPQAVYLDTRLAKLVKSYSLEDPQRKNFFKESWKLRSGLGDVMMREDPVPQISSATAVLTFRLNYNTSATGHVLPATRPLELNFSALENYGYRLGFTASCAGNGASLNGPWDPEGCTFSTHAEAGCVAPRCALLQVGTAVIAAWKADDFGFNYSLHNSKEPEYQYGVFESLLTLKHLYIDNDSRLDPGCYWKAAEVDKVGLLLRNGITPGRSYLMSGACPDSQKVCPYLNSTGDAALDCEFWEKLGYGFPHRGRVGVAHENTRPPTHPLHKALGGVMSYVLDNFKSVPFLDQGFLPANALEGALEEICDGASSVLSNQLAVGLVGSDSTKSISGALLDLSVTVIAIIAMATGRKDLEDWLYAWSVKALCGRLPVPTWCITAISKVCTCLIISLSLIVAPAAALYGDIVANGSNPKGDADSTSVGWLSANTGFGKGPFHVTAIVTITLRFQRDEAAFALVIVNTALASFGALCLCLRVFKPQSLLVRPARSDSGASSSSQGDKSRSQDAVIIVPAESRGSPDDPAATDSSQKMQQQQHSEGHLTLTGKHQTETKREQQQGGDCGNDLMDQGSRGLGSDSYVGVSLRHRARDYLLERDQDVNKDVDNAHGGGP
jgi:hypothetical protein